ncbi:hypothetical protein AB0P05_44300 [Streptomyces flaveolus]|uniref:hypothetical protein n=1 Tax=Streptomyces flaveolus TaxID=67297 RepID=UPI00343A633A
MRGLDHLVSQVGRRGRRGLPREHICVSHRRPAVRVFGLLGKQLFNVTRLVRDGYDDAHTDRLPLIVRCTDEAAKARTPAKLAGSTTVRALDSINGAAVAEDHTRAPAFWSALTTEGGAPTRTPKPAFAGGVAKVWLDGRVTADPADSIAQIGGWGCGCRGTPGRA